MLLHTVTARLTYANVASTICLFIALGGSAYAAASISGKDVKNGSLTSADVKDHSLRARDFKAGALPRGPMGPQGEQGPAGAPGAPGRDSAAPVVLPPAPSKEPIGRLSLPGITGDGPGGKIEVRSVAWSNALSGDPFGGGVPKPVWGELMITKAPDRSSPQLWKLTASGQHLPSAKLELSVPGASAPYATYDFKDVSATTFATHGSGAERRDDVGLSFNAASPPPIPALSFDPSVPLASLAQPRVGQMTVDGISGDLDLVLERGAWSTPEGADRPVPRQQGSGRLFARAAESLRLRNAHQERDDQAAPAGFRERLHDLHAHGRRRLVDRGHRRRPTARAGRVRRGEGRVEHASGRRRAAPRLLQPRPECRLLTNAKRSPPPSPQRQSARVMIAAGLAPAHPAAAADNCVARTQVAAAHTATFEAALDRRTTRPTATGSSSARLVEPAFVVSTRFGFLSGLGLLACDGVDSGIPTTMR